jgi:hypothetical protein
MPDQKLFLRINELLLRYCKGAPEDVRKNLALLVVGLFLGRHVQLWEIALWVPLPIQLTSIVRRFERFLANPAVDATKLFEPFVNAMLLSLGNETVYLVLDCTQAGRKCRTLLATLAYNYTALPLAWKTLKGKKGHVTGEVQKTLLEQVQPYLRPYRHVIVLGDAEFSNATVLTWLQDTAHWDFVMHTRGANLVRTADDPAWQPVQELWDTSDLQPGQVQHWPTIAFTQEHQLPDLTLTIQWAIDQQEPLFLISNLPVDRQPQVIYERRFWIETLFGNAKSRGFELARTHLSDPAHIDRLILAIAIATHVTLGLGTQLVLDKQTHWVDRSDRRDLSLFQMGWRWLYRLLALNRLPMLKLTFCWDLHLPKAGFQPAK